jgi:hypothetical protein
MNDPCDLADDQLLEKLDQFVAEERGRLPFFLACLGEADRRKLPEERGYSSTFDYCVCRLKLSEDEAYRRISAARAAVSRPELLSSLADGLLSLTAVSRIAPHVDRDDAPEIIARAEGKSTRELETILAPLCPEAAKPDRIRTITIAVPDEKGAGAPLLTRRVDFSFQGPPELREAIERAKELLSHQFPLGGLDEVLLSVLQDYLQRHDPQTALELGRPAPARGASSMPANTRRAVWARDGGRCVYCGPDGIRCRSRRMIEIDHKTPRALGGSDELTNLRLLCRSHNDAERRRLLGEGKISTNSSRNESVDNCGTAGVENRKLAT